MLKKWSRLTEDISETPHPPSRATWEQVCNHLSLPLPLSHTHTPSLAPFLHSPNSSLSTVMLLSLPQPSPSLFQFFTLLRISLASLPGLGPRHYTVHLRAVLLLQFMEHLDKLMYNAYEGSCVTLPPVPKVYYYTTYYITHMPRCVCNVSANSVLANSLHCLLPPLRLPTDCAQFLQEEHGDVHQLADNGEKFHRPHSPPRWDAGCGSETRFRCFDGLLQTPAGQ